MRRSEQRGGPSSSSIGGHVYSSVSFVVRARSMISLRRNNQVVSMENAQELELRELELFQAHVAERLSSLATDGEGKDDREHHGPLVTLSFLQKLLDAFICIEEEFKALLLQLLFRDPVLLSRPPVNGLVDSFLDAAVKSLDICNAVTQALESLGFCQKQAEIAASALAPSGAFGEAQLHRARRALSKLLASLAPSHRYPRGAATTERASSFGRSSRVDGSSSGGSSGNIRQCLSLNVYRNWSAARQIQSMWASLAPPRAAETSALVAAVYTMNAVNVFVMWTLVTAFSGQVPASFPPLLKQLPWAAPMAALQERVTDDGRGTAGAPMVRCGRVLAELDGQCEEQLLANVSVELAATCQAMENNLSPLQRSLREVFHRVVLSRAEILDCLSHGASHDPSTAT
ncbi:unnamed protein product [Spirodela intermedia]|uniref:Uncharacterized protein n=1 Tax=Spirodela intermedia TaxID=51605 RepID=A0A7I8IF98_SPIIN|nr:unnamed protein product [Spirodela intermedia]CAA6656488.1 unnamed protein product [Spirodela intermedia]